MFQSPLTQVDETHSPEAGLEQLRITVSCPKLKPTEPTRQGDWSQEIWSLHLARHGKVSYHEQGCANIWVNWTTWTSPTVITVATRVSCQHALKSWSNLGKFTWKAVARTSRKIRAWGSWRFRSRSSRVWTPEDWSKKTFRVRYWRVWGSRQGQTI